MTTSCKMDIRPNSAPPRISVIVPIFGVGEYLSRCAQSLVDQRYGNLEIILVNDGSKDNCGLICDSFAEKYSNVKVIHKENGGLVSARKAGLQESTGDYVGYVDGDDWVDPEMFEDMAYHAMCHDADIVVAGHKEVLADRVIEHARNQIDCGFYKGQSLVDQIYSKMLNTGVFSRFGIYTYSWNKLFRRPILIKNQMLIDEKIFIGEDAACVYPSILDSSSICVTNSTYYNYRQRVNSSMKARRDSVDEIRRLGLLYQFLKARFEASEHASILMPQLDQYLSSLLVIGSIPIYNNQAAENELFQFRSVKPGQRIAVCGAGTFGQHLVRRIKESNQYTIVAWLDEHPLEYQALGLPVKPIESIRHIDFEHIIIAFINRDIAIKTELKLITLGLDKEKIASLDYENINPDLLLKQFGVKF